MLTALTTLAAIVLALLGAFWLPGEATRLQGGIAFAVAAALGVVSFWQTQRAWPRLEPEAEAGPQRRRRTQSVGAAVAVIGLALTGWALLDIWDKSFAWDMAQRWAAGLVLLVIGAYLIGNLSRSGEEDAGEIAAPMAASAAEPETPTPPPVIGPRPSGYKLRAIGLTDEVDEEAPPTAPPSPTAPPPPAPAHRPMAPWLEIALVAVILAAAIFFRVYRIDSVPPGIFVDETNAALDALRTLEGRPLNVFATGWYEVPNGYIYLQALTFRLLGTTFQAIKLQSLIPGIVTVLALYFLGRELFGVRPALFAMAFVAVNRWHFHMSRWGWVELFPTLMQILSVYFIARAARLRSWGDWALAGVLLGLGMYTYLAIRLAVAAIALYLLYRIVVQRGFLRRNWQGLILFSLLYALTFAPLAATYYKNPFTFLNRSQQVTISHDIELAGGSLQPLWESVSRHLQMFHVAGDFNARHNLPGAPMVDPITGAFLLLGLAWAVWRWRDHRHGLLVIWIGVTLLGGILSRLNEAPQTFRTLAVVPAVALLAADAYDLSLRSLLYPARSQKLWQWICATAAVIGLVAAGWLNYDTYFHKQAEDRSGYIGFSPLETTVAREVLAKRDDHQLYLSPRLFYFSPVMFLTFEPPQPVGVTIGPLSYSPFPQLGGGLEQPGYRLADPALDLPLPDLGGDGASFLLDLHFEYLLDYFRYFYPDTTAEKVTDRYGQPFYLSVTIPGDEISALQARNRADAASEIRGLYIPASGQYQLRTVEGATIALDGQTMAEAPRFLGRGLHAIAIADLPGDLAAETPILFWDAPAGAGPVPDSALFRLPPSGRGLLGTYYSNSDWQPPALMEQIDPYLLTAWPEPEPVFGPFSATWTGTLMAASDGLYSFTINADDGVRLWLDDQIVGESLNPDTVNQISAALDLTTGSHPIRIDYFQRGGGKSIEFFWAPPGQPMQPVAPAYLQPGK